jgi:hypothetical protein
VKVSTYIFAVYWIVFIKCPLLCLCEYTTYCLALKNMQGVSSEEYALIESVTSSSYITNSPIEFTDTCLSFEFMFYMCN